MCPPQQELSWYHAGVHNFVGKTVVYRGSSSTHTQTEEFCVEKEVDAAPGLAMNSVR